MSKADDIKYANELLEYLDRIGLMDSILGSDSRFTEDWFVWLASVASQGAAVL